MRMVAKSGCPVIGQRHVNSGASNAISKSRSGLGLGKVSICFEGFVVILDFGFWILDFAIQNRQSKIQNPSSASRSRLLRAGRAHQLLIELLDALLGQIGRASCRERV